MTKTKKIFFPRPVGDAPAFVNNIDEKLNIGGLGAKYTLSPDDMLKSSDFKTNVANKVSEAESAQATAQSKTAQRDEEIYNAKLFYNEMGHKMQKHAAYDAADMEALGFFVIETPADPNTAKPVISKITILPDQVILDWVKGAWDGVYIESYVVSTAPGGGTPGSPTPGAGTPVWVKIGEDEKSPYEDTRTNVASQPETRFYRMRYKKDNKPVGLYSDVVKVIVEIY